MSESYVEGANWYENELPAHEPVVAKPKLVLICAEPSSVPVIDFPSEKLSEPVSPSVNEKVSPLVPLVPWAFIFEASLPESVQPVEGGRRSCGHAVTVKLSSEVVVVSPMVITPESLTLYESEAEPWPASMHPPRGAPPAGRDRSPVPLQIPTSRLLVTNGGRSLRSIIARSPGLGLQLSAFSYSSAPCGGCVGLPKIR